MKLTRYEEIVLSEYLEGKENKDELEKDALERLEKGEPIAYITGVQYFFDLALKVTNDVLVPRLDSEHLALKAIEFIPKNGKFIDLGTGSGCLCAGILLCRKDLRADAVDISEKALELAKENIKLAKAEDRINFIKSDILNDPPIDSLYDAVVSNPPYIKTADIEKYPSLSYEPYIALDGGEDGMKFYRKIISDYKDRLTENGIMLFEIGYDEGKAITELAFSEGFNTVIYQDFSKNDRVAFLKKRKKGVSVY